MHPDGCVQQRGAHTYSSILFDLVLWKWWKYPIDKWLCTYLCGVFGFIMVFNGQMVWCGQIVDLYLGWWCRRVRFSTGFSLMHFDYAPQLVCCKQIVVLSDFLFKPYIEESSILNNIRDLFSISRHKATRPSASHHNLFSNTHHFASAKRTKLFAIEPMRREHASNNYWYAV